MVDNQILEEFIHNFYGYGTYRCNYWFIGMEEAGGNSIQEINRRLSAWEKRGQLELEDVAEYHFAIDIPEHFRDPVKLQPTWNKLIRILLSAENRTVTLEDVRQYQKNLLGRSKGESCLLELLPLPSPSTGKWTYAQVSDLPFLKSRQVYAEACTPFRIEHLRDRIQEHQPHLIVFYSFSYQDQWRDIAGTDLQLSYNGEYYTGGDQNTLFLICKHPAARGITNQYFDDIGKIISKENGR